MQRLSGIVARALRLACLAGFAAGACSDPTGPGSVTLTILSGDGQTGLQNTALSQPIVLEAEDAKGDPVAGARLTITVLDGSGRVLGADTATDGSGQARIRWELGEAWENTLVASLLEHSGAMVVVEARARYVPSTPEQVADGWETASLTSVGMNPEPLTRMMDSLRAGAYPEVHSIVIIRDGRLVFEEYFPGHDFGYSGPNYLGAYLDFGRTTRHNTHSATKSVISALVGLAMDRGLLAGEDQSVFDFFPDYAAYNVDGKDAITIRDMLTMTSGLEWHEWDAPVGGGQNSIDAFNRASDPIGYVLSQPLLHTPGSVFNYNGGTVNVLCQMVARAAGITVDRFADETLFGPMGVSNYNFPHHFTGMTVCHGDIYITPRDMAKFGSLYLNQGVWRGDRILSREWVQKSLEPLVSVRPFNLGWAADYGYLWWLNDYAVAGTTFSTFKALGWGGQEIWVVPGSDLVVVFTGANYTINPPCDELMTRYVFPSLRE
ncbi:MAG: serine hydrolase [Longimicrobiales bacterium]